MLVHLCWFFAGCLCGGTAIVFVVLAHEADRVNMTEDDRSSVLFGKAVAVCSFVFLLFCAALFVVRVVEADHAVQTDTTPLLAPPEKTK